MNKNEQPNYSIEKIKSTESNEFTQDDNVPIIDIVRHGASDYKELRDSRFEYSPNNENFKLDLDHLDINKEGMDQILETAEQIENISDKDNEIIMIVSSSGYRADSSLLLIENYLDQKGFNILNPGSKKMETGNLRQLGFKNKNDIEKWFKASSEFRGNDPEKIRLTPSKAHEEIAKNMGHKDIKGVFTEDYKDVNKRFNRFLRHMTNIYRHVKLNDASNRKRLRIVCLTHEEVPAIFMEESLKTEANLDKGQVLEIKPKQQITNENKYSTPTQVTLYPKGETDEKKESVINFSLNK